MPLSFTSAAAKHLGTLRPMNKKAKMSTPSLRSTTGSFPGSVPEMSPRTKVQSPDWGKSLAAGRAKSKSTAAPRARARGRRMKKLLTNLIFSSPRASPYPKKPETQKRPGANPIRSKVQSIVAKPPVGARLGFVVFVVLVGPLGGIEKLRRARIAVRIRFAGVGPTFWGCRSFTGSLESRVLWKGSLHAADMQTVLLGLRAFSLSTSAIRGLRRGRCIGCDGEGPPGGVQNHGCPAGFEAQ